MIGQPVRTNNSVVVCYQRLVSFAPPLESEVRSLIRKMMKEKPTWGAPRIWPERLLLGHDVAEATVAKYVVRPRKPPSQTWRTFLASHFPDIAACDFFTVPTVTFRVLHVLIGLGQQLHKIAISAILRSTYGNHHVP